jgi:hypothetical protein
MADSTAGLRRAIMCVLLTAVPACSGSAGPAARVSASADAAAASGSKAASSAGASAIDYCALFTTAQVGAALGKPVKPGQVPEMATDACQWDAVDGKGVVSISATVAGVWFDMSGHASQRSVQGIGKKAYIGVSAIGGVQAGAVAACGQRCPTLTVDSAFYHVRLDPSPSDDAVLGLLRDFIDRSTR